MDKVLDRMARRLAALDEASLMEMWEKYAARVTDFEPSKRWEEAVLILGMIQSVRFKNQLFNYHWSRQRDPRAEMPAFLDNAPEEASVDGPSDGNGSGKRGKLLSFKPRQD